MPDRHAIEDTRDTNGRLPEKKETYEWKVCASGIGVTDLEK